MSSIQVIKLVTGEEIVGQVVQCAPDGTLELNEVMSLEMGHDEEDPSKRYVYMVRYAPFSEGRSVTIRSGSVVFQNTASPVIVDYYKASIEYSRKFTDEVFDGSITATAKMLKQLVTETTKERSSDTVLGNIITNILNQTPTSNSVH